MLATVRSINPAPQMTSHPVDGAAAADPLPMCRRDKRAVEVWTAIRKLVAEQAAKAAEQREDPAASKDGAAKVGTSDVVTRPEQGEEDTRTEDTAGGAQTRPDELT
jgi:hypothetical protein